MEGGKNNWSCLFPGSRVLYISWYVAGKQQSSRSVSANEPTFRIRGVLIGQTRIPAFIMLSIKTPGCQLGRIVLHTALHWTFLFSNITSAHLTSWGHNLTRGDFVLVRCGRQCSGKHSRADRCTWSGVIFDALLLEHKIYCFYFWRQVTHAQPY